MSKEGKNEVSSSELDAGMFEDTNSSLWRRFKGKATLQVNESSMAPDSKGSNKGTVWARYSI
jgi:hypothetical protein